MSKIWLISAKSAIDGFQVAQAILQLAEQARPPCGSCLAATRSRSPRRPSPSAQRRTRARRLSVSTDHGDG